MSGQGKFDALTKQLITHILGFKEGEENFVRSEQYVLSNLLYHHCLAVNSHAVRRSIDGLVLKFKIHGQHHRANTLTTLTQQFLTSPLFKNHYETDIEWSLLSLLLHLSNSPTQVPLSEGETHTTTTTTTHHQHTPIHEETQEEVDWTAYLREDDPLYVLGPEEPLSDWSEDECEEISEARQTLREPIATPPVTLPSLPDTTPAPIKSAPVPAKPAPGHSTLAHLHSAKAWLRDKTHAHYWGARRPHELPTSDHPLANVAKLCESSSASASGVSEQCQQLSEWTVMREVVWCLTCPAASHVFHQDQDNHFTVRQDITLPSTTPGATRSMLEYLCEPLGQLCTLDTFLRTHNTPCLHTPTPVTLMAYAAGLRHWRHALTLHLNALQHQIKEQEGVCTLLWLEGELLPWLHTLSVVFTIHSKSNTVPPQADTSTHALRLLGCLCEGVEGVGDSVVRGVVLRLLLHTFRPYLSIIHTWLIHGTLSDHTHEFIIQRDESVTVYDERFWYKAFTVNLQDSDCNLNTHTHNPVKAILKILSPLLPLLTSVGKSQELLDALGVPPLPLHNHTNTLTDCSLEEVVMRYIIDTVCKEGSEEQEQENSEDQENSADRKGSEGRHNNEQKNSEKEGSESEEKDSSELKNSENEQREKEQNNMNGEAKNSEELCNEERRSDNSREGKEECGFNGIGVSVSATLDPLLMAAYTEQHRNSTQQTQHCVDHIESLIESIGDIRGGISMTLLLTSALQPLVKRRQEELSAKLSEALLHQHNLALHCQALCSVMLMEAGDVMHEFYSHLFDKLDFGEEGTNNLSLTLHLQYCVDRVYPNLAPYFSVTVLPHSATHLGTDGTHHTEDAHHHTTHQPDRVLPIDQCGKTDRGRMKERNNLENLAPSTLSLTRAGIPEIQISYQAPWPANLLLTDQVMKQYNKLFNFSLSLKRVTTALERLKFKELSSWKLIRSHDEGSEGYSGTENGINDGTPVLSLLHRLQLLRHWLFFFSRELHDHFANTAFLPFYQAIDKLFKAKPSFNDIITEHEKLLNKLASECLVGRDDQKILPLQFVLNKVFWLVHRVCVLWEGALSCVSCDDITALETQYSQLHRYLANFLTTMVSKAFTPHLEGLTGTLVDTVPLLTHL